jgi:hypothetical protein
MESTLCFNIQWLDYKCVCVCVCVCVLVGGTFLSLPVGRYGHQVENRGSAAEDIRRGPHIAQLGSQDPSLTDLFFVYQKCTS